MQANLEDLLQKASEVPRGALAKAGRLADCRLTGESFSPHQKDKAQRISHTSQSTGVKQFKSKDDEKSIRTCHGG